MSALPMTLAHFLVVLVACFNHCFSQTTTSSGNDVVTNYSSTTTTGGHGTESPTQELCTPLADYHSAEFCTIPGRNSQYTYPQSIPGVQDTIDLFAVEILTFTLETLDPQAPPECVDASIHVACLYLVPPCDPDLDLRLPICERSCEAIVRLRAEGTCVKLDAFINDLSESSVALRPLRDVYFSFDCRNVSTYDAYEGTLNFTKNGECTSIISPAYEELVLNRPPACTPIPEGLCSQQSSTRHYSPYQLFSNESTAIELLNELEMSVGDTELCRNMNSLRDIVCSFVYPPCLPESGMQLGFCSETCTSVSAFVSECIPTEQLLSAENESSVAVHMFAMALENLNCSENGMPVPLVSFALPKVGVKSNQCINNFGNTKAAPNYVAIVVPSVVGILVVVSVVSAVIVGIFISLRRRNLKKECGIRPTVESQTVNDRYELNDLDEHSQRYYTGTCEVVCLTEAEKDRYRALFSSALISYNSLKIGDTIGEGAFGKVFKGQLSLKGFKEPQDIAIKTIKNLMSKEELKEFFTESLIMKDFDHPHILGLTGVCFDTPDGYPFLVSPFMVNGSLKSYLKKSRVHISNVDTYPKNLPLPVLIQMCLDIAQGMKYLADKKFVHRDLAARNCMVDATLRIKVGDFGLARDVYSSDYYRANKGAKLPVKWMPPETLFDSISNEKTDVWSYGVTCWEVFSLGRAPYPGISNHDVLKFLSSGGRLEKPTLCPDEVYSIVKLCWELKPENRLNFSNISDRIENYWERDHAYVFRSFSTALS